MNDIAKTENKLDHMSLIALAIEKGQNIDQMERLFAMKQKHEEDEARKAYAEDMVSCQSEMPVIAKNATNSHTSSPYAKIEQINKVIVPVYTEHGFCLSFGISQSSQQGWVTVTCEVMHKLGHVKRFDLPLPADNSGSKNAVQGQGSTITYAQRYLTGLIFNLTIDGIDTDGEIPADKIDGEALSFLENLLNQLKGDQRGRAINWIKEEFKIDNTCDLPKDDFSRVTSRLEKSLKKNANT